MVHIRRMFRLDGGLWGIGVVIGSALALGAGRTASAQVSLQRHTLPGVASPAARMQVPGMTVDFDTSHGGVPLYWYLDPSGYSIIDSFPGRGLSVIYEPGGQDATQAGATGNIDFPIARIGDAPSIQVYNYYARETAFQPPSGSNPNAVYEVTGFGPFFWISHEAPDDAIPNGAAGSGWDLYYTGLGNPSRFTSTPGAPIWFQASAAPSSKSGILLVGNEQISPSTAPWNQRLCEIKEGRFASKVRISLSNASSDAFASLMFRRQITSRSGATIDDAYGSSGYFLNVNRSGVVQLLRVPAAGAAQQLVWDGGAIAPQVANANGVELELRTHNGIPGLIQVFVDGVLRKEYTDPSPLLGPHFGLFAFTRTGSVMFWNRQVFDVGVQFRARYTGRPDGLIESDITVEAAPSVSTPRDFYPWAMPYAYLNRAITPNPPCIWSQDSQAHFVNGPACTAAAGQNPSFVTPLLRGASTAGSAGWAGDQSGQTGLYATPTLAQINNQPATGAYMFQQILNMSNLGRVEMVMGSTPLPVLAPMRYSALSQRMVSLWGRRRAP